ncbi:hypothetical protein KCP76_08600 [Salmonella enterica subsp. enterica serovar Weltevreden]|nr:hypothetical protein KCP76_08600 [Salmonella enterica subsp. enterica serovar Weltevreden]
MILTPTRCWNCRAAAPLFNRWTLEVGAGTVINDDAAQRWGQNDGDCLCAGATRRPAVRHTAEQRHYYQFRW